MGGRSGRSGRSGEGEEGVGAVCPRRVPSAPFIDVGVGELSHLFAHELPIGASVHGVHLQVKELVGPTTLLVEFMHPETFGFVSLLPGDALQFTRADTLEGFGTGVVKRVTLQSSAALRKGG